MSVPIYHIERFGLDKDKIRPRLGVYDKSRSDDDGQYTGQVKGEEEKRRRKEARRRRRITKETEDEEAEIPSKKAGRNQES